MKLIDIITGIDFEKIPFAEVTSKLAKGEKKVEAVTEETKEFFREYISEDFWRSENEKEAIV